jgi:hypothetical protein
LLNFDRFLLGKVLASSFSKLPKVIRHTFPSFSLNETYYLYSDNSSYIPYPI